MRTALRSRAVGPLAVIAALAFGAPAAATLTVKAPDGAMVFGEPYLGELDADAPLVLLFHQARSSGRGEYEGIARWLNESGFRAIAWDLRSGGDLHGQPNRTAEALGTEPPGYCDVYPDLQAALDHVVASGLAKKAFVWGSSYSAALVFQLAARNPEHVAGVLAFSPAGGGPVADCLARDWLDRITAPAIAFRPASELTADWSVEQRAVLEEGGVEFHVVENGVHGSSMLVDDRTGHDMSGARAVVEEWLTRVAAGGAAPWIGRIGFPQYFSVQVADVDRSVEWYRTVFGLRAIGGSGAEDGAWRIENLRSDQLFVEIVRDDRARADDCALGFGKVGFFVADLEAVADRVARATGERPRILDFEPFRLRLFQIRDPDGNVIQLHSATD
jgi:pimeloyl-ACP methyl ester carboxylesterase